MSSPFPPPPPIPTADGPVNLILPPTEDRPHRYFVLPNGMEVVVVSDVKADKSAASMDVGVGHLSDPDDLPGCAHFCEHLLFMGTKTYPKENEYSSFLSAHNGHSNAYTAMTSTVYHFDVAADALEGALDRFSGFFTEPLFNEDCTEREIKAVDSEHKKNIQNDMWRFFQLEKFVFREDHPYHKFGTGNYETLWSKPKEAGRDPRQELIDWWAHHYCARRMKLAVIGKEDLDTLERWVRERFEKVPVKTEGREAVGSDGVRLAIVDSPIGPKQMKTITFTKPVRDARGLEITFPFPDVDHLYGVKPGQYISHFLGHEGRGSLQSYLKGKGWINVVRAGMMHGAAGFDFVKVTVDLTPLGLEHYQDVAIAIFKYIALLRSEPPSSSAFNEIKRIAEISFKFADKGKNQHYATSLSNLLQEPVPRDQIVSARSLLGEFDAEVLSQALQLLDPRRAVIGVTAKELPKEVEGSFDQKEPIYGTEYKQIPFSEELLKEALSGKPIPELHLPGENKFIPERLDVNQFDVTEPALRPELLRDTPLSRVWYKQDDRFWLPKATFQMALHSPLMNASPRHAVLGRLFCELFSDSITEDVYDADLAELSFSLQYTPEAISVGAAGFSDKLAVLVETMLTKLVAFEVDAARFGDIVEDVRQHWKNFKLGDPIHQAVHWDGYAVSQVAWTQDEKLAELEFIKPADVQAFGKEVLQRLWIETLIHGNTSSQGANEVQDMVERVLKPRPLAEAEKNTIRTLLLPSGTEHIWPMPVPNVAEVNSALIYHLYMGSPDDVILRAKLQLFDQIAHEPAFNTLRTKEQLGYIVGSSSSSRTGTIGLRVYVQSEKEPVYVETRVESFLDGMREYVEEMSDEDFENHKMSLIAKKEEKPKNLYEETGRFWSSISSRYYEFGKRETDISNLRKLTKSDILNLVNTSIHTSSSSRTKISVHMKSQYQGIKFDVSAAQPLIEAFTTHKVPIDNDALQALMSSQPDLDRVKEFARAAVNAVQGLAQDAKTNLENIVDGLKGVQGGGDQGVKVNVRESNVWIQDINAFKAGLVPSKAAQPLEPLKLAAKL
ncbi:putative A-factor processing enzyme [Naematelia encephala]|uniref:Putative A-factor processing enzyme n=1 Tax=Naematelia encephala TaxID=71784 RepID=A0A1Y2BIM2_9TREE|nr:putative A-factor processing enzyme [Naematelia encephala]